MFFSFSLCMLTLFSILVTFSSPNSLSISPICRTYDESTWTYEVKAVIPLGQVLFLVVHDLEVNVHIVHEIIQTDIDLQNPVIYLDFSVPMQMMDKWRLEPLLNGRKIQTAFSGTNLHSGADVITFVLDDQTSLVLTVSTKIIESGPRFGANLSMVLDMDNRGYRFAFEFHHWTVEDISSSSEKVLVLINQEQEKIVFRNGSAKEGEEVANWAHLSGFIHRHCLILFANKEVYILRPAYYQLDPGKHFIYDKFQVKHLFTCTRNGQYDEENKDNDLANTDSWFSHVLLFFLLLVVAVSFYIRSVLIATKRNKPSYTRIYCSKDKY